MSQSRVQAISSDLPLSQEETADVRENLAANMSVDLETALFQGKEPTMQDIRDAKAELLAENDRHYSGRGQIKSMAAGISAGLLAANAEFGGVLQELAAVFGIALSVVWYGYLINTNQAIAMNYRLLHALESKLTVRVSVAKLHLIENSRKDGTYIPISHFDKAMPILFFVAQVGFLVYGWFTS